MADRMIQRMDRSLRRMQESSALEQREPGEPFRHYFERCALLWLHDCREDDPRLARSVRTLLRREWRRRDTSGPDASRR